jgi:pimeloyl-ACP methyl ester carboxylesterase
VSGNGPAVILQHALTSDCGAFELNGFRAALVSTGYRCITPDSIAHGRSSAPEDPQRYVLSERVADITAVADAVGAATFAFVGYSMGAWIGTGLLCGARVTAAVLGGWDPLCGAKLFSQAGDATARKAEIARVINTFAQLRGEPLPAAARLEGQAHCYEQLFAPIPALGELTRGAVPVKIYCGEQDPYFPNACAAARQLGAGFASATGNHVQAFTQPRFASQVLEWLRSDWPPQSSAAGAPRE